MSHFKQRLALLKTRSFGAYTLGAVFAALGNGMGYIAMTWLVVHGKHSVGAVAILMACFWGPNVILGPLMGVLADRFSRKIMITLSCLVRGSIYLGFSFYLKNHLNVHVIYLMMIFVGIAFSAFYSSAFAFMRELVPNEKLIHANSIIDIAWEVGNMVGIGSAGLLIAWQSAAFAIGLNGIMFFLSLACIFFIKKTDLIPGKKRPKITQSFKKDFISGLRYLKKRPTLRALYTIQLLIFVTFLTAPLLLVPFSKFILHTTAEQFGIIEASASIGVVIGGILMPWLGEKWGLLKTILFFCSVLCLTFLLFGYNRMIPLAGVFYFMIGFAGSVWPLIISRAQHLTAPNFQGRVQSTFNSLSGGIMLLFYLTIGTLSRFFGIAHLYMVEVVITTIAIIFLVKVKDTFKTN